MSTVASPLTAMVFSFSRLSLFEQCPYRFYLRYIEREEEPTTEPLALGKATHKGIEQRINTGCSIEEAALDGLVEADFYPLKMNELQDLISRAKVTPGMGKTETYFHLPLCSSSSSPTVQGFVDLDMDTRFVDWKTNRKPYNVFDTMQLPLYAWALMTIKEVKEITGAYFFLRWRKWVSYTFTMSEAEKARRWAYEFARRIEQRLFLLDIGEPAGQLFPAKPSRLCRHCPFAIKCLEKFGGL